MKARCFLHIRWYIHIFFSHEVSQINIPSIHLLQLRPLLSNIRTQCRPPITKILHLSEPLEKIYVLECLTLHIDVCRGSMIQAILGVRAGVCSRVAGAQDGDGQMAAVWVRVVSVVARLHTHTLRRDGATGIAQRPAQLAVTPDGRGSNKSAYHLFSSLETKQWPQPTLTLFMFGMAAVATHMGTFLLKRMIHFKFVLTQSRVVRQFELSRGKHVCAEWCARRTHSFHFKVSH